MKIVQYASALNNARISNTDDFDNLDSTATRMKSTQYFYFPLILLHTSFVCMFYVSAC